MIIKLIPQRRDDTLEVFKDGDVLTVNGEVFDFSPMPDNCKLPSSAIGCAWFFGDVVKSEGEITVSLFLPLPYNYSPEQAFPKDLVDLPDGEVIFPGPLEV